MKKIKTLHTLFEEYVTLHPDHIAVIWGMKSLTYHELNTKSNQLAHYLRDLNLKPETPIALCLERSFDFLITVLAILKAGGAYMPLDVAQPEERLMFLLNDSQAPFLITKSNVVNKFTNYQGKIIQLDLEEYNINHYLKENPEPVNIPNHLAYIIYTSGSTGLPKGVLIEHQSVVNYCEWFEEYIQCKPQQLIDFSANPIFDMAITTSIIPLLLGLTISLCDDEIKKEIKKYVHYLVKLKVNIIKLTPSYFKLLLQEVKNNFIFLPKIKSIVLGGENLSTTECRSWIQLYPDHILFNEYGPTETTVAVTIYKINRQNIDSLNTNAPIGVPGNNMSCFILNANNQLALNGEIGELFIGGMCLARGYLNQPDLTQRKFIMINNMRLYKTGDLCTQRADGNLEYQGRIDDQVKIRGYRIEPPEIEKRLLSHPEIVEVAVVAQKGSFDELRLVAYILLKDPNKILNTYELRHYLQKYLPDYMIPSVFVNVTRFPLTPNGKLDKAALPVPLLAASQNYIEPVTSLEKKLARLWSEELGVQLIGIYDDFFDLGGHSLSAARIVIKINNKLQRNISIYDFYKSTNIAQLAILIKRSKRRKPYRKQTISSHYNLNSIPLNDFQFLLWMAKTFEPRIKQLNIVTRKRLKGRLNKNRLEFAFKALFKKHEALIYQINKLQPTQKIQNNWSFKLFESNLESLSANLMENELQVSFSQLICFNSWSKNKPLVIARLFYLSDEMSELQICLPHLISDEDCADILYSELSHFYQSMGKLSLDTIEIDSLFKEYVFNEQSLMQSNFEQDIHFWEEYLKDSCLFTFPKEYVVHDMKAEKLSYSTYSLIPQENLNQLKHFCESHHFSINNALCAIIALALRNCCVNYKSETPYTFMNIVQSTRDNPIYDKTIGCFLRVRPIKMILDDSSTLTTLSQQIQQSTIETSKYQHCANLVKLCSVSSLKSNKIENLLVRLFTPLYTKFLKIPTIYRQILTRCGSRMISFKRNSKFIINLNIRSNFITFSNKNENLFGFNTMQIKSDSNDLLTIDNVFEASLFSDDNQNAHYLVISANLKPMFREMVAKEVFNILNSIELDKESAEIINHEYIE